jgi:uncharacterized phage protein (TIGR02218 family)
VKDFSPLSITEAAVGFPARVGVVTRRDGTVYRFAESDEAVTIDGDVFSVVPGLQISAIKHTSNGETPSCQFKAVHSLAGLFSTSDLDVGLFDGASVQIYNVDRMNQTRKGLWFTGSIGTIKYSTENEVVFDVMGPSKSAKILVTETRSPMCRVDLFSTRCGVDKTLYDVATTVSTIPTSFTITVTGSLAQASGYFNQGVLVASSGVSLVISNWVQSTQTISTYQPCDRILSVGLGLTLYPGCDKTLGASGCGRYSNAENFQGEPHFLGTAAAAQQV